MRRTCAGSSGRRPRTTPPRARGGWSCRWSRRPTRPTSGGITPALEIILDAAAEATRSTGTGVGVVVAASRIRHPLDARTLARLAVRYAGDGPGTVVGFGLSNDERRGSLLDFAPAFEIARRGGLALVPHGGELLGPASVVDTLTVLRPDRVGHGVRASEDPAALDRVAESGVTLEVCPGSNLALGVYADPAQVPLRSHRRRRHTGRARRRRPSAVRDPARGAVRAGPRLSWASPTPSWPPSPGRASRAAGRPTRSGRPPSPTSTPGWRADPDRRLPCAAAPIWSAARRARHAERHEDCLGRRARSRHPPGRLRFGQWRGHPVAERDGGRRRRHDRPGTTSAAARRRSATSDLERARPPPTCRRPSPTTFTDVNQTITDPDLKDSITVKRLARALPWPAGYKASAQAYELVGARDDLDAVQGLHDPDPQAGLRDQHRQPVPQHAGPIVNEAMKAAGLALLPDQVDKGDPVTGWLVFKVDPRNAPEVDPGLHAPRGAGQRQPDLVPRQDVQRRDRRLSLRLDGVPAKYRSEAEDFVGCRG